MGDVEKAHGAVDQVEPERHQPVDRGEHQRRNQQLTGEEFSHRRGFREAAAIRSEPEIRESKLFPSGLCDHL